MNKKSSLYTMRDADYTLRAKLLFIMALSEEGKNTIERLQKSISSMREAAEKSADEYLKQQLGHVPDREELQPYIEAVKNK